jgi:signal transduction histidine kinase
MSANITVAARQPFPAQFLGWWLRMERVHKFALAASVMVVCGAAYVCSFLGTYIEEAFSNKAAANTALYMDSFVEPLVQGLSSSPLLPAETRGTLERLLSPASIGKPVVGFRIWVGDRIVFSNRSELIGRTYPASPARSSAGHGEVVATFGSDSDDDEYERSLGVPILEIHAPIRRAGTHDIIAIAETTELASELTSQIRAAQYTSYAVITTLAAAILLALFGFGGGVDRSNARVAEAETFAARLCAASGFVIESTDRDRRSLCAELHSGPLQHAAFALLRVEALRDRGVRSDEDVEVIGKALETCVAQLRELSNRLPPDLNEVRLAEVLNSAVDQHVLRCATPVTCNLSELPHDLPYALKACLLQFLQEGLVEASRYSRESAIEVFARSKKEQFEICLRYDIDGGASDRLIKELTRRSQNLQYRVEALRGALSFRSVQPDKVSVTASFVLPSNPGG